MPRKRRRFQAVKQVKALARERVGTPPPSRAEDSRKPDKLKHKKKTLELYDE